MAVQSDTSRIQYAGNNSTTTSYAVPFVFQENAHLKAIARTSAGVESVVTLTNHTGAGNVNGGTVRTAVAVPATSTLTIYREVPATQTTTYAEGGDFPAASHERALDKLTQIAQQLKRNVESSVRMTDAVPLAPLVVPTGATPHVLTTVNGAAPTWETVPSVSTALNIPSLTDASTVNGSDELIVQQSGVPKRATANELLNGSATVTATGSTTARTLKDRFADTVNVKDFGAVGDGVADDTAAIQAAIAAGNNIYIPSGTYLASIDLSASFGKTIKGAGRYSTFIKNVGATAPITIDNTNGATELLRISDLALINRNETTYANTDGISITGIEANRCEFMVFENLWIQDFRRGISITGRLIWTEFRNIHSINNVDGLYVSTSANVSQLLFSNCRFGTNTGYGAYIAKTANDSFGGWHFDTCTFELNGKCGFYATGAIGFSGLTFTSCYMEENAASIASGASAPKKANIDVDCPVAIGLNINGCSLYGNTTSALDWNIYISSAGNASGFIGANRTGVATNGFLNAPSGFVVAPQDGNDNRLTLASGSLDLRKITEQTFGQFTATLTGCTTTPTGAVRYVVQGKLITLYIPAIVGTSNSTAATLTGMPSDIFPTRTQTVTAVTQDGVSGINVAIVEIGTGGTMTLYADAGGGAFANSGTKGIRLQTLTYSTE